MKVFYLVYKFHDWFSSSKFVNKIVAFYQLRVRIFMKKCLVIPVN